jgi:hypothetical protein
VFPKFELHPPHPPWLIEIARYDPPARKTREAKDAMVEKREERKIVQTHSLSLAE